jgi:hypothetical protein
MIIPIDNAHREEIERIKNEEKIRDPEILLQQIEENQGKDKKEKEILDHQKHHFAELVKGVDIMKEVNTFKKKNNSFLHRLKVVFGFTK